ncbi:thioredoxin reductase [Spiroplasma gladiatoris]|uniref:Thioredoxin reductase n=1 Tax=Spiroplasma gladiatoris TaxID=2143 RepID=A0A4P7AID0_9MOLU|nr:NAD(P)/FAD-dependent oxidoreductase [Spiroplasma gladiatoris]QBQ07396.1 thioredoxin reductase [Spiroplasma gladiatoris]
MIKDVLIIGAGAAGLYAWKIARNCNLTGTIVENEKQFGGQITRLYPTKPLNNLPGIKSKPSFEVIKDMYDLIEKNDEKFEEKFFTTVVKITPIDSTGEDDIDQKWFRVDFSDGTTQDFKRILFTIGLGFYKYKKIVKEPYDNILYSVQNTDIFKDKNVVVFGGGDSAIDFTNIIVKIAKTTTLVHRREEFRGSVAGVESALKKGAKILTPYIFEKIIKSDNNIVEKISLKNAENNELVELDLDFAVVNYGMDWDVKKNSLINFETKDNWISVGVDMNTSIKGIFAAGDCCYYEGKIKNLVSSFYEAMKAILKIDKEINSRKVIGRGW